MIIHYVFYFCFGKRPAGARDDAATCIRDADQTAIRLSAGLCEG